MPTTFVNRIFSLLLCGKHQESSNVFDTTQDLKHLPNDIIVEILSRLPVKSLLRFRCTCRSWRNLIASRTLVNQHLRNSNESNNDLVACVIKKSDKIRVADYNSTLNVLELNYNFFGIRDVEEACTCNGLVCILEKGGWMWVLNPITRKYKILPRCTPYRFSHEGLGFGYDPSSDDYLIIRLFLYGILNSQVRMYSFNKKSWTTLEDVPYALLNSFGRAATYLDRPTLMDSALHWVGTHGMGKPPSSVTTVIIAFNTRSKRFQEVQIPDDIPEKPSEFSLFMSILNRCLCLCHYSGKCLGVWMMKEYGVRESWVKLFNIEQTGVHPRPGPWMLAISKKGEFLVRRWSGKDLCVLDPKNDSLRDFMDKGFTMDSCSIGMSFVESLVPV